MTCHNNKRGRTEEKYLDSLFSGIVLARSLQGLLPERPNISRINACEIVINVWRDEEGREARDDRPFSHVVNRSDGQCCVCARRKFNE